MARFGSPSDEIPDYISPRMLRWRSRTNGLLTVLAIGTLPLIALEFVRDELTAADRVFLDVVEIVVFVAFGIDYVVQLAMTPRRGRYVRAEWLELLLVVSQGLAMLPAFAAAGALRGLRATRAIQLIAAFSRVAATAGLASHRGREFLRRHSARFALSLAGFTWVTAAVAFTIAEDVAAEDNAQSFGDGVWWALTTITTVGYGDVAPATPAGRVVGGITMVIGVGVFAVVTASIAQFLLRDADDAPASGHTAAPAGNQTGKHNGKHTGSPDRAVPEPAAEPGSEPSVESAPGAGPASDPAPASGRLEQ